MGIRETLNQNPGVTTGVTIGIVVIALVVIVYQLMPESVPGMNKAWFSPDDGETWFADDITKVPPVTSRDGKEAPRAHVYRCGKGKPFVAYLERMTPQGKAAMEKAQANVADDPRSPDFNPGMLRGIRMQYTQVKKPGDKEWVAIEDARNAAQIQDVVCPDGTRTGIQPVYP
jgi:hypothetical protein